jgi:hypothetical protein
MMLPIPPQIFNRIQFRGVGWKKFQLQTSTQSADEISDQPTAMDFQSIPYHHDLPGDMPQEVLQKDHDLRSSDGPRKQSKIEMPPADSSNGREPFPIEMILQHRRLPLGSPGSIMIGPFTQTALIHKDYGLAPDSGVFLKVGQRRRFQFRMAASSRSKAWELGRWQLHPSCRNIFQTWPTWKRIPLISWIKSVTRPVVQRLVLYPKASGPCWSLSCKTINSAEVSLGFLPARPAFFNPVRPASSSDWHQRLTDCRLTPSFLAIAAWVSPFLYIRAACIRLFSNATKSLLTPRGFPMGRILSQVTRNVTILCEGQ